MHPYAHRLTEPVRAADAFADELMLTGIVMVIVIREAGYVYETVDQQRIDLHEQAEVRDTGDNTVKFGTKVILHILALEPGFDIAGRFLRAAFVCGGDGPQSLHRTTIVIVATRFTSPNDVANCAMHEQIRVAANWRGEMRIRVQCQAEVADVIG